jgi:outer membrane protein assembly factor BamB
MVNGYLFALDTDTGAVEWHKPSTSFAGLAAGSDRLYVVETQSVKALRRADGGVAWSAPAGLGLSPTLLG